MYADREQGNSVIKAQREMEHDASHRREDKTRADHLRIVTEQIPPKNNGGRTKFVTQTDVTLSEWAITRWVYKRTGI